MNKKLFYTLSVLALALFLTSCEGKAPVEETVQVIEPEPEPAIEEIEDEPIEEPDEFYTSYMEAENRPIAVMIDNDNKKAWPHAGISDAYLIYEITVEGAATRLMALFPYSVNTEKIGPVRSARHYFLDYALEHDALYTHFGWSPKAIKDIPALGINNINGLYDKGFWRERKYAGDYHSAFTSIEKLKETVKAKGYRTDRQKSPMKFSENARDIEGETASSIAFAFASFYNVRFEYDAEKGTYKRIVNGSPYKLQEDIEIAAENIIVMIMSEAPLGDGSPRINISDVGEGNGYFVTRGKYIPIKWSKTARDKETVYKDTEGNEIALNPGQTWVEIVSPKMKVTIE